MIGIDFNYQVPGADLAKRFGNSMMVGGSFLFKLNHNFLAGVSGNFIFSGNVREDTILDALKTSTGNFISSGGTFSSVILGESGYTFQGKFGKIFPAFHINPNTGIMLMAGAGFIQHKIKIRQVSNDLPQFSTEYAKGYDRLTNGFCSSQFLGFAHFDPKKLLNFYTGFEVIEGFTQNRRSWNFDSHAAETARRLDILLGLKICWFLPLYGRTYQEFYTH